MDYKEERPLSTVYNNIMNYHRDNHASIYSSIGKPASTIDISNLEKVIGVNLPNELLEVYQISEGQAFDADSFFYDSYTFMSSGRAADFWKVLNQVYASNQYIGTEGDSQGPVRNLWWHSKWIPFAENIAGDALCIDLIPAEGGHVGQIIEFIHDDTPRAHLGFRLVDFLGEYENGLRSGKYGMHSEWGVIVDFKKDEKLYSK